MRKAVVDDQGRVINIVELVDDSNWQPPVGHTLRDATDEDVIYQPPLTQEQSERQTARTAFDQAAAKARQVLAGDTTFTAAEMQRAIAHLILRERAEG